MRQIRFFVCCRICVHLIHETTIVCVYYSMRAKGMLAKGNWARWTWWAGPTSTLDAWEIAPWLALVSLLTPGSPECWLNAGSLACWPTLDAVVCRDAVVS